MLQLLAGYWQLAATPSTMMSPLSTPVCVTKPIHAGMLALLAGSSHWKCYYSMACNLVLT